MCQFGTQNIKKKMRQPHFTGPSSIFVDPPFLYEKSQILSSFALPLNEWKGVPAMMQHNKNEVLK